MSKHYFIALALILSGTFVQAMTTKETLIKSLDELNIAQNERLMDAAERGDFEAAKSALEDGANPNYGYEEPNQNLVQDRIMRDTALWRAIRSGNEDLVELFLEKGADINAGNIQGETALFMATKGGIAQSLIRAGAEINMLDTLGMVPLKNAISISGSRDDVFDTLLANKADLNVCRHIIEYTILFQRPDLLEILLEKGATRHIDVQNPLLGNTALIIAARSGLRKAVELLLMYEADPTITNIAGKTAAEQVREELRARPWESYYSEAHFREILALLEKTKLN